MRSQSASNARLASGALAQVSQSQPHLSFTPAGLVSRGARSRLLGVPPHGPMPPGAVLLLMPRSFLQMGWSVCLRACTSSGSCDAGPAPCCPTSAPRRCCTRHRTACRCGRSGTPKATPCAPWCATCGADSPTSLPSKSTWSCSSCRTRSSSSSLRGRTRRTRPSAWCCSRSLAAESCRLLR